MGGQQGRVRQAGGREWGGVVEGRDSGGGLPRMGAWSPGREQMGMRALASSSSSKA